MINNFIEYGRHTIFKTDDISSHAQQIFIVSLPTFIQLPDQDTLCVGVLSDTHIPFRIKQLPSQALPNLQGCDVILHAGDLEDPDLITQLSRVAPTYAVRGNIHWQYASGTHDLDLPRAIRLQFGAHRIWMTHGDLNFRYTFADKLGVAGRRIARSAGLKNVGKLTLDRINQIIIERLNRAQPPHTTLTIFGHSHKAIARQIGETLYFNPGAVCGGERNSAPPSMARLHLKFDGTMTHEWLPLSID